VPADQKWMQPGVLGLHRHMSLSLLGIVRVLRDLGGFMGF